MKIIATKVGSSMEEGGDKDISKEHILKAVDDSRADLKPIISIFIILTGTIIKLQ